MTPTGTQKYVIANGDESEPGTFKDRLVMEGDPFAVVEAMVVFGTPRGRAMATSMFRGEYPMAERRLRDAVEQTREAGLMGRWLRTRGQEGRRRLHLR